MTFKTILKASAGIVALVGFMGIGPASAVAPVTAGFNAAAFVYETITVTQGITENLNFGQISAPTNSETAFTMGTADLFVGLPVGGNGTIVPASGAQSGTVHVTGSLGYTLTLMRAPLGTPVACIPGPGTGAVTISDITLSASSLLMTAGDDFVRVGGTLHVPVGASGTFACPYTVTAEY
jgi:hypothetical protein